MNNFEAIQRALVPIPLGPVGGGKPLDGDGAIIVVDPATEDVITEIANGTVAGATTGSRRGTPGAGRLGRDQRPVAERDLAPRVRPHDRASRALGTAHRPRERESAS